MNQASTITNITMLHNYRHYSDGQYPYFITSTIVEWLPVFLSHRYFNILTDACTYCRNNKGLLIHAYVLMPNHFHLIASSQPQSALPSIMRDLKRYTSREITRCLEEDGARFVLGLMEQAAAHDKRNNIYQVWQEGYHPKAIFTQKFFRQKLEYLHSNPIRKGYVDVAEHWLYSSASHYLTGSVGMMKIDRLDL